MPKVAPTACDSTGSVSLQTLYGVYYKCPCERGLTCEVDKTIVGSITSVQKDYTVFGVMMVAFSNGVGGGILRDVLLNEVPWLLRTGLYGTISMGIGLLYFLMSRAGFDGIIGVPILLLSGVLFRMLAYKKSWHLPALGDFND